MLRNFLSEPRVGLSKANTLILEMIHVYITVDPSKLIKPHLGALCSDVTWGVMSRCICGVVTRPKGVEGCHSQLRSRAIEFK
jgi:hypothetical protein